MRGKPLFTTLNKLNSRITPADAGKTSAITQLPRIYRDHPRGCGENSDGRPDYAQPAGSPPRMRGKRGGIPIRTPKKRITPADAGKTSGAHKLCSRPEDHPRGCGENQCSNRDRCLQSGSPPRMRGKRVQESKETRKNRITPADAGKTARASRDRQTERDHPRGCGENDRIR